MHENSGQPPSLHRTSSSSLSPIGWSSTSTGCNFYAHFPLIFAACTHNSNRKQRKAVRKHGEFENNPFLLTKYKRKQFYPQQTKRKYEYCLAFIHSAALAGRQHKLSTLFTNSRASECVRAMNRALTQSCNPATGVRCRRGGAGRWRARRSRARSQTSRCSGRPACSRAAHSSAAPRAR